MGTRGSRNADPYTFTREPGGVLLGRPEPGPQPAGTPQAGQEYPGGTDVPTESPQGRQQAARGRWVPLREAAARLDTTQAALRMRVDAGELEARGAKKHLEVKLYPGQQ